VADIAQLAHSYFKAFERADRAAMEGALAPGFTFTSPYDDHISREQWFERCWPYAASFAFREPMRIFVEGDEAFVQYETDGKAGGTFSNAELLRFEGERLVSVTVFFGFVPQAAASAGEAEAGIRAVLEERIEAMRVKDAGRAIATTAPDVVAFELAPPLSVERAAARDVDDLAAWLSSWDGPVAVEMRDLRIEADGDIGWCHSLNRLQGVQKGGRAVDLWMRSTLCFRRSAGAWTIAHGHSSVPFHMDGSFRAATDLKP
jgi:ketosteroid isomerase-like protein